MSEALPHITTWIVVAVVAWFFLRAHNRLLKSNDDLTSQIVAMKNPWAAQMFGQMKAAQNTPTVIGNAQEPEEEEFA